MLLVLANIDIENWKCPWSLLILTSAKSNINISLHQCTCDFANVNISLYQCTFYFENYNISNDQGHFQCSMSILARTKNIFETNQALANDFFQNYQYSLRPMQKNSKSNTQFYFYFMLIPVVLCLTSSYENTYIGIFLELALAREISCTAHGG